jgi:NAD(P)-dependent dehydrogenase (short-subunit alcohol dehydrogenase family)
MPFHVTPLDDMDFMYNVNQKGTFLCMQEQIKIMLKQDKQGDAGKRGVIVNMASMSGLIQCGHNPIQGNSERWNCLDCPKIILELD